MELDTRKWRVALTRILIGLALTCLAVFVANRLENRSASSSFIILEEQVSFQQHQDDRTMFFTIETNGTVAIELRSTMKEGILGVQLLDPNKQVVYEKSGKDLMESKSLAVTPGKWSIRVYLNKGMDGTYSIHVRYQKDQ